MHSPFPRLDRAALSPLWLGKCAHSSWLAGETLGMWEGWLLWSFWPELVNLHLTLGFLHRCNYLTIRPTGTIQNISVCTQIHIFAPNKCVPHTVLFPHPSQDHLHQNKSSESTPCSNPCTPSGQYCVRMEIDCPCPNYTAEDPVHRYIITWGCVKPCHSSCRYTAKVMLEAITESIAAGTP